MRFERRVRWKLRIVDRLLSSSSAQSIIFASIIHKVAGVRKKNNYRFSSLAAPFEHSGHSRKQKHFCVCNWISTSSKSCSTLLPGEHLFLRLSCCFERQPQSDEASSFLRLSDGMLFVSFSRSVPVCLVGWEEMSWKSAALRLNVFGRGEQC